MSWWDRMHRGSGLVGTLLKDSLTSWAASLPDQAGPMASTAHFLSSSFAHFADIA
jgi:hypothetical protein